MAAKNDSNELLRRQLHVLAKHWKLLPLLLIITFGLYGVYWLYMPKQYESEAEVQYLVETPAGEKISAVLGRLGVGTPTDEVLETQADLLRSHALLGQVLEKLGVVDPSDPPAERERLIEETRKGLRVERKGKTNILRIELRAQDPELVVKLLNALIQTFQIFDANQKRQSKVGQREYLMAEIEGYEKQLEEGRSLQAAVQRIEAGSKDVEGLRQARMDVVKEIDDEIARLEKERADLSRRFQPGFPLLDSLGRSVKALQSLKKAGGAITPILSEEGSGPTGVLRGVVFTGALGGPRVAGAVVTTRPSGKVAYTDEKGDFAFDLPSGTHEVYVSASGYKLGKMTRQVEATTEKWASIALREGATGSDRMARIDGQVFRAVSSRREPVADAEVEIGGGPPAVTDGDGRFSFLVPAGAWLLRVRRGDEIGERLVVADWGKVVEAGLALARKAASSSPAMPAAPLKPEWKTWQTRLEQSDRRIQAKEKELGELRRKAAALGLDPSKERFYLNDLDIKEEIYLNFKKQLAAVDLALSDISSSIVVLREAASARLTVLPRPRRDLPSVLLLSIVLFMGLVFTLEALNPAVEHLDEIEASGIKVLGVVRHVTQRPLDLLKSPDELSPADRRHRVEMGDLCRMVKVNLDSASDGKKHRAILMASCASGEGKSTLTLGLGAVYAQSGCRTLIVNANVRHPTLDKELGMEDLPGLLEVLEGTLSFQKAIVQTPLPNLSYLPGRIRSEAELAGYNGHFEREAASTLVDNLRNEFDIVLFDSPPLLRVSDTLMLSRLVDFVTLVYAAGQTPQSLFLRGIDLLRRAHAPVAGVILNHTRQNVGEGVKLSYYPKTGSYYPAEV
ncbi:MAG: AAA family ATPase [Nitrospirae bacterium]|nr:AAA family ATPase [Nitrospirota bacterium]